ncbi:MAG: hypothetical protein ACRDTJ_10575, partial [Pseudonocardiaceae bacterium]
TPWQRRRPAATGASAAVSRSWPSVRRGLSGTQAAIRFDRHFELTELETNALANYRSLAEKHIRPLIGSMKVGALDGGLFDSFCATLRRCRDHCDRR